MRLKTIFGYCSCKGCRQKYETDVQITAKNSKGKEVDFKAKLCRRHVKEILKIGKVTSIMYG
ncbi:MAG: hypothetical protein UF228_06750 [Lachnospiraceae bacterium]|nr:hypothetical protein [Lachnospiraceae bacterium]